jgi:hypothetical protein
MSKAALKVQKVRDYNYKVKIVEAKNQNQA